MVEHLDVYTWLGSQLMVAAAIWGGIRSDLRSMHKDIERVQALADEAHHRLNEHLEHTR